MIIVCQVNRSTNQHYEGTERNFDELEPALNFMLESFKNMYGTEVEYDVDFWDPELKDLSTQVNSVELFAPGEDDGWYLFRAWHKMH